LVEAQREATVANMFKDAQSYFLSYGSKYYEGLVEIGYMKEIL
jgi:hypothetical protein